MNLRQLLQFDKQLNPLSSLSTFQVDPAEPDPLRVFSGISHVAMGNFSPTYGTFNNNLVEKFKPVTYVQPYNLTTTWRPNNV